tara:strand:+ start:2115 stop:2405 length:291 start_codon:yes stop_codon:yes gene_type:complete
MRNYIKNNIKDRLAYCIDWKNSIEMYLANKEIIKKANDEYYKSKPLLKLLLGIYFIPFNTIKFLRYLRIIHDYKKNQIEIKVLTRELNNLIKKEGV